MSAPSKSFGRRRIVAILIGLVLVVGILTPRGCLPGHWRPSWVLHVPDNIPKTPTGATWQTTPLETEDGRFLALTLSGGGSRSANFGAAVMLQLDKIGVLQQVDVISAVSGGTIPAVYYAIGPRGADFTFNEESLRKLLGIDFERSWLRRWFLPHNILRSWFTDYSKSDVLVQVFNRELYHKAIFRDLRHRPKVLLNATLRNTGGRFTFTDETFATSNTDLSTYRLAAAVAASSAFPGVFDDVVLEGYSYSNRSVLNRSRKYSHLYDGGAHDNLGVNAVKEYLIRAEVANHFRLADVFPKGCMIIIVDAATVEDASVLDTVPSTRNFLDYFLKSNAFHAFDILMEEKRSRLLSEIGLPMVDNDAAGTYVAPFGFQCKVRHVSLRSLLWDTSLGKDDEKFIKRVTTIPTRFKISAQQQDDLYTAAKILVKRVNELYGFL
jgi:predicted acylesterase/phospholipase RssA